MNDGAETATAGEHSLSPQRAAELIEAEATLIDVRRPYEFEAGHLVGARNIEVNELPASADQIPGDRAVLFYCRTGNRSSIAVDAFRKAGYQAHNLTGGIEAWVADGRALEPDDGEVRAPLPPSS